MRMNGGEPQPGALNGRDPERYEKQKLDINILGAVTMSEVLVEEAGTLLDHLAEE